MIFQFSHLSSSLSSSSLDRASPSIVLLEGGNFSLRPRRQRPTIRPFGQENCFLRHSFLLRHNLPLLLFLGRCRCAKMSLKLPIFFLCCCVFFASIGDAMIFSAFSFSFSALWYAAFCAANLRVGLCFCHSHRVSMKGLVTAALATTFFLLSFAFVVAFFAIFFSSSASTHEILRRGWIAW